MQHNDLSTIPKCLLELPSLGELNLSSNKLMEIPAVAEWSPCLTVLNLSNNQLQNLPLNVVAPAIRSLNLARNHFRNVPLCICSFTTLHSLNLSDNPDVLTLPAEMGRLSYLSHLNLSGLKDLNDPPKNLQKECRNCIRYLNMKMRNARGFYRMKLMLVGYANRGKTTLVARLQGKEYGDESTVGVDVSEWWYRPSVGRRAFHFSIWDFGGQEEYYATHQCFLSQRSLYLLLFNLLHGDKGVEELRPWLNNIALRAPRSCVIIVGTHLDEVQDDKRGEIDALLHRVGTLAASYNNKLQIVEVLPVGLKNRIENIGLLKEAIYNHTAGYKNRAGQLIMGQKIPASYHALDKQLQTIQHEVRQGIRDPIMHAEEFRTMVHQMNLADIQDDDELKIATLFLTDVGSLLHYDDRGHNLHELYFVDPRWLCDMMSKVVTIKERNPFIKNGILYSKDIPMLFKDKQFPWQYFEQYLTLLDRFEIALPLDNRRVLIPSMLLDERPAEFEDEKPDSKVAVYSRFVMFSSANTPPGFWSRLLSRIMHSVPKVCFALDKSMPITVEGTPFPANAPPSEGADSDINYSMSMSMSMHPMTPTEANMRFSCMSEASFGSLSSSVPGTPITPDTSLPSGTVLPGSSPPPTISGPLPLLCSHQHFINAPQLLPNFLKPLPNDVTDSFDAKEIHLEYWRTGLYYKDPEIMFRVESLLNSKQFKRETKDGVLLITSANNTGKKIIGQLVDLVVSLINEWYPGLQEGKHGSSGLEQKVPCFECVKLSRVRPFEFKVEQCLPVIAKNETMMECGYFRDDPHRNHAVSLADIVPDLLLQDIDPEFLLSDEDIIYQDDDASLLGKGGYGKVYRGKCKGKSVAIKKYLSRSEDAFTELRSEAKLQQQCHHPCIVSLVGVCVHPLMALVLEEAPLRSLEFPIVKKKLPVHRLTIFRIAAEVVAALRFLHSRGIIFRDLKAGNVLLWTLDPDSLCHCKVADFGIATHLAPIGARGLQGTKGFIAPEVLHIGKRKQRSVYDHRADIFSFGMFLYQIIARRHPYHNIPPHRIDVAVESCERPKLQDVDISRTGYYYLTKVMKCCWEDNPNHRPDTETIIRKVCLAPTQMVMCVAPVGGEKLIRQAIAITPSSFAKAGHLNRVQSELWVCCDSAEGAEVSMYNTHSMVKVNQVFIKDNQVQCLALCGDHVWVGSRAGIGYISIGSRELICNTKIPENSVSCITATDKAVYLGTLEGYCFTYNDISRVRANVKPRYKYISEHAVDGIVCTHQCVWVAHTRYISLLNFDCLELESSIHDEEREAYIGQVSFDPDRIIVWSAHLGGVILSAWDAHNKSHMYDVDTGKHLKRIAPDTKDPDLLITAMTPALDTVWVGMASGHIMVFHEDELLSWFHPYRGYVRFLTCIPSAGPCEMEKAVVASGGKYFISLVEDLEEKSEEEGESSPTNSQSGTIIMWEAYEAKTMRQVKLIERNSPGYLDNYNTVRRMIHQGEFRDGTHIKSSPSADSGDASAVYDNIAYTPDKDALPFELSESFRTMGGNNPAFRTDSLRNRNSNFFETHRSTHRSTRSSVSTIDGNEISQSLILPEIIPAITGISSTQPEISGLPSRTCAPTCIICMESISVRLPESEQVMLIRCEKPVKFNVLLSEVEVTVAQENCQLEFTKDGRLYKLQTQEQLEEYLKIPQKPQLCVVRPKKHFHTCIPSPGPCALEEAIVASGGKGNKELEDVSNRNKHSGTSEDYSGTVVVSQMSAENIASVDHEPRALGNDVLQDSVETSESNACDSDHNQILEHSTEEDEDDNAIITNPAIVKISETRLSEEEIKVEFLNSNDQSFIITCEKPVQLESVMNEIQLSANLDLQLFHLFYSYGDSGLIMIHSQEDFERYLAIPIASRPTLIVEINQSIEEDEAKGGVLHPNLLEDLSFTPRSQSDVTVDMVQEAGSCEMATVETENEEHLQGDISDDHTQETENGVHLHSDVLDDQNVTHPGMQRTDDERVEVAASSNDKVGNECNLYLSVVARDL